MIRNIDNYTSVIELGDDVYFFYAGFGTTNKQQKGWAIRKQVSRTISTSAGDAKEAINLWADGNDNCDKVANDFLNYSYRIMPVA